MFYNSKFPMFYYYKQNNLLVSVLRCPQLQTNIPS